MWQELDAAVAAKLSAASVDERTVFAAGVAERLLQAHEALPAEDQRAFTIGLRPLLNAVWDAALGDQTAFQAIKHALGTYYLSEFCHNDGQDGPGDADEPAAAAVLYAAEAYMHGCVDFAVCISGRAVEAMDELLNEGDIDADDPDEVLADELRRQLRDLDLISTYSRQLRHARSGLSVDTTARLNDTLRPLLSRVNDR
ncbi:hypothetical protein amrb99_72460 [Actinomadura sp. RB99]|nr:hypothetical protein [Actinomadura sp. RB99]